MPHPIVYTGTQDDDRTRSIDIVHIEPSIREGVILVSSLYGSDASAPLYRFAPSNTTNPWISGDPKIPNTLTCNEGVWLASPKVLFSYQWMTNGVDIPGETNRTYLTNPSVDGTTITCEVKGFNFYGEDYGLSAGLNVSLIEPIEIGELEFCVIQGLEAEGYQTLFNEKTTIISGISADNRMDLTRSVSYFLTGLAADTRHDLNAMGIDIITGISQDNNQTIQNANSVAVISYENIGFPLINGIPHPLPLLNPQAELGMTGWTTFGLVGYEPNLKQKGTYSWHGGYDVDAGQGNTPYTYMNQTVAMYSEHETDIDAGLAYLQIDWFQYSYAFKDMANIKVEFLDASLATISVDSGPGLWASPDGIFYERHLDTLIPVGTRFIKVIPEFNLQDGEDINAHIDSISMFIRKGALVQTRDFGPSFEQWRVRFVLGNTWSGGAVSEIEFRNGIGGVDLATGGSPIFGSAGLGVINADYAFDDLRNTGYWAGEENAITLGTAWLGYNMGIPVRPLELDITARASASDALQVPKAYYIEGSNNGTNWTKHYYVDEELAGTSYVGGEQRQILLPSGNFPFYKDHSNVGTPTYARDNFGSDDVAGKGAAFFCHARINITDLAVYLDDNQNTSFNYHLQLARVSTQKNGSYQNYGMITEILEDIAMTSPGTNSGLQWVEQACFNGPHEFEVGDLFVVRMYDLDADTNPVNTNEGRTRWIDNWNGNSDKLGRRLFTRISEWSGGPQSMFEGQTNPTGYVGSGIGRQYALDIKGNIF